MTDIRAAAAIAEIGHNRAPLSEVLKEVTAELADEVEDLARRANITPREVTTEDQLSTVSNLVKDARSLFRKVDARRVAEKEPYLTAEREVDAHFKVLTNRVNRIETAFQTIADAYQRAKAAEERRKREEEARKLREAEERKRQEAEEARRATTKAKREDEADILEARAEIAEAEAVAPVETIVETVTTATGVTVGAKTEWTYEVTDFDAIPLDKLRPYLKRDEVEKAIRLAIRQGVRKLDGVRIYEDVKAKIR